MRRIAGPLAGLLLLLLPGVAAAAPGEVTIRRGPEGVPHIQAKSFEGIGYGYAYAHATCASWPTPT